MTEIIYHWLNDEVKLSRKITNISELSNGYLIGELLNRYKLITNFLDYKNDFCVEAIKNNFKLIEQSLVSTLDLRINTNDIRKITDKTPKSKGVIAKLLYQIKMKLARRLINFESLMRYDKLHKTYMEMKFPNDSEKYLKDAQNRKSSPGKYSKTQTKVFEVNKIDKNKENLELPEIKHLDAKNKEEIFFKNEQINIHNNIHEKEKNLNIKNLEKDKNNIDSWNKNMTIMKNFKTQQYHNNMKEANYYRQILLESFKKSNEEKTRQIDAFDKNLARLGLDITNIDPKLKKSNNMSSEMIFQMIKEKIEKKSSAKKEKDRRLRIINVEHSKKQLESKKDQTGNFISAVDKYDSSNIKRLEYENWRSIHERNQISEIKKLHETHEIGINSNNYTKGSLDTEFNRSVFLSELKKESLDYRIEYLKKKKFKQTRNYSICQSLINLMIDLTYSCHNYQNDNKTDLIDIKEWRNWSQLFVDGKSTIESNCLIKDEDEFTLLENAKPEETHISNHNTLLSFSEYEESEFLDYLNYIGQWTSKIIPSSIPGNCSKITDILTPDFFNKGKKSSSNNVNIKNNDYELRDEDVINLMIPKENVKNFFFSDIINIILEIKMTEYREHKANNLLDHIHIKTAIIGRSFSGKKSQAKAISDWNSHIKVYNLQEMIKKNLEILDRLEIPIESNPKYKNLKKPQLDQLLAEKSAEEEKMKDIKNLLNPIRDIIKRGDNIKDEKLVDILLQFIKLDFPENNNNYNHDLILKKHSRKKEIIEELSKIKEEQIKKPKNKIKEAQQLQAELTKLNSDNSKGFILLDFPQNIIQAKILEDKLTEYKQAIEKPKTQVQVFRDWINPILDNKINYISDIKCPENTGLDFIFYLDVPSSECIRREKGRRIDPHTGTIYHIEDNPPPSNDHKIKDRLTFIDDGATESQLIRKHKEFDLELTNLIDFYAEFKPTPSNLKYFNIIDGKRTRDNIQTEVLDYFLNLQNKIEEKEIELIHKETNINIYNKIHTYTQLDHLNSQLTSIQEDLMPTNMDNSSSNAIIGHLGSRIINSQNNININQHINDEEDHNSFLRLFEEAKKKLNPNQVEKLFTLWIHMYEKYICDLKRFFKFSRKQTESAISNFTNIQIKFIQFLKRPSKKVDEVNKYQAKYNRFSDEYPQLKDDPQVKEEFNKDSIDLSDRIWKIILQRKNEAIEERSKIISSGWIEQEIEKFHIHLEHLFVSEVERFLTTINIIREFYLIIDQKIKYYTDVETNPIIYFNAKEVMADITNHAIFNEETGTYPRLVKLFNNCLKLLFKYDEKVLEIENKVKLVKDKSNKGKVFLKRLVTSLSLSSPNNSKLSNKKLFSDGVTTIAEKNYCQDDLKNAIKNEKAKYNYRLTMIKYWGINKMNNMLRISKLVLEKIDDWIISTIKAENDAMNNLIMSIRNNVNYGKKIKNDIELDVFDIYNILNINHSDFLPTTGINKERNLNEQCVFNLDIFQHVIDEIRVYEVQKNYVKISTFDEIYIKKYLLHSNIQGIPDSLRSLSFHNFNKFTKYFEFESVKQNESNQHKYAIADLKNEYINIRNISIILILLHCKILDKDTESNLKSKIEPFIFNNTLISKDDFMSIEFWFEKEINITSRFDEVNIYNVQKSQKVKEVIFHFFKQDTPKDTLLIYDLLNILSLKSMNIDEETKLDKTYYEVLLF